MKDRIRMRLPLLVMMLAIGTVGISKAGNSQLVANLSAALFNAQIGLLSFCLAMGTWRWSRRFGLFGAGTATLLAWWWRQSAGTESTTWFLAWAAKSIVLPQLLMAAGFLVARYARPKVCLTRTNEQVPSKSRPQFSVRQLMTCVMVAAILVAVARPFRAYMAMAYIVDHDGVTIGVNEDVSGTIDVLFYLGWDLLGVVFVNWTATWAGLAIVRPVAKSILALLFSVALGLLFTYYLAPVLPGFGARVWCFLPVTLMEQSLFTIASLLVVRSCGYRLISHRQMETMDLSPLSVSLL